MKNGNFEERDPIDLKEISSREASVNNKGTSIHLKEIETADMNIPQIRFTKSMYASLILAVMILPTLFISLPIILDLELKVQDTTASIHNFERTHVDGDEQHYQFGILVTNPSQESFTIQQGSFDLLYKNYSLEYNPDKWTLVKQDLSLNRTYDVGPKENVVVGVLMAIDDTDTAGKLFLKMALMHRNHTVRMRGNLSISLEDPNTLNVDITRRGKDLFSYEVSDDKNSHFLINNDLIAESAVFPDTMTNIIFKNRYDNPFNFEILLKELRFDLTNGTTKTWASYEMTGGPYSIGAYDSINISSMADPTQDEITKLLSDLLSGVEDPFVFEKMRVVFQLGSFEIEGLVGKEIVKSDMDFALDIVDYTIIPLTIDLEFGNPSGIDFNLSYIDITVYLAGTSKRAIWYADNVEKPPYDYVPVISYGKTRVDDISPSFNLVYAIQALEDKNNVDMLGYFTLECYQYVDNVPFLAYDVEM